MRIYIRLNDLTLLVLFITLLLSFQLNLAHGASCKGSVTFYWKEVPAEMKSKQRNWGVLEKKLVRNYSKLSDVMDVENSYAFIVDGNCCWEVREYYHGGETEELVRAHTYHLPWSIRSVKLLEC